MQHDILIENEPIADYLNADSITDENMCEDSHGVDSNSNDDVTENEDDSNENEDVSVFSENQSDELTPPG